ncbi:hypothetical protein D3C85_1099080 [compost metagenome]
MNVDGDGAVELQAVAAAEQRGGAAVGGLVAGLIAGAGGGDDAAVDEAGGAQRTRGHVDAEAAIELHRGAEAEAVGRGGAVAEGDGNRLPSFDVAGYAGHAEARGDGAGVERRIAAVVAGDAEVARVAGDEADVQRGAGIETTVITATEGVDVAGRVAGLVDDHGLDRQAAFGETGSDQRACADVGGPGAGADAAADHDAVGAAVTQGDADRLAVLGPAGDPGDTEAGFLFGPVDRGIAVGVDAQRVLAVAGNRVDVDSDRGVELAGVGVAGSVAGDIDDIRLDR